MSSRMVPVVPVVPGPPILWRTRRVRDRVRERPWRFPGRSGVVDAAIFVPLPLLCSRFCDPFHTMCSRFRAPPHPCARSLCDEATGKRTNFELILKFEIHVCPRRFLF